MRSWPAVAVAVLFLGSSTVLATANGPAREGELSADDHSSLSTLCRAALPQPLPFDPFLSCDNLVRPAYDLPLHPPSPGEACGSNATRVLLPWVALPCGALPELPR